MTHKPIAGNYRRVKIVFWILILISIGLVALSFFMQSLAGFFLHETNSQTFDNVLTDDQKKGIFVSVGSITLIYILLLAASNLVWVVGVLYIRSLFEKRDKTSEPGKEDLTSQP